MERLWSNILNKFQGHPYVPAVNSDGRCGLLTIRYLVKGDQCYHGVYADRRHVFNTLENKALCPPEAWVEDENERKELIRQYRVHRGDIGFEAFTILCHPTKSVYHMQRIQHHHPHPHPLSHPLSHPHPHPHPHHPRPHHIFFYP